jgi:hypothetical protein
MCKYGVKFNMLEGPLAIRPFSPCAVSRFYHGSGRLRLQAITTSDIDENAMLVRIRASTGSFTRTKATSHTGMPYHTMLGSFIRTEIWLLQKTKWFEQHLSMTVREGLHINT